MSDSNGLPAAGAKGPRLDGAHVLAMAREVFAIESAALIALGDGLGQPFVDAVACIMATGGRVAVMGMGKSGHVGRKIAATLASTGTPAFFVHPAEAAHGDLGMVQPGDVALMLSNSGESDEISSLLPAVRRLGIAVIAITAKAQSTLARHADVVLSCAVEREACPLNLAPTASTTAQMAMGDALAVALLDARGFREQDFARSHPGGALGRKLLMHVRDLMRSGDALPVVGPTSDLLAVLEVMNHGGLGFAAMTPTGQSGKPAGIFTDGDLRRLIATGADLRGLTAAQVMRPAPKTIRADALAVNAVELMEQHQITSLLAVDDAGTLVGALNTNDLLRAKVI